MRFEWPEWGALFDSVTMWSSELVSVVMTVFVASS